MNARNLTSQTGFCLTEINVITYCHISGFAGETNDCGLSPYYEWFVLISEWPSKCLFLYLCPSLAGFTCSSEFFKIFIYFFPCIIVFILRCFKAICTKLITFSYKVFLVHGHAAEYILTFLITTFNLPTNSFNIQSWHDPSTTNPRFIYSIRIKFNINN